MNFASRAAGLLLTVIVTVIAAVVAPRAQAGALQTLPSPAASPSMAPRLTSLGGDAAVLTWLEPTESGHRLLHSIHDGAAFGPARPIAEGRFFANWADTPGLLALPGGAWYAHWLERSGQGTYAYDVRVAVSRNQGASWSEPFTPHRDGTLTEHGFVSWWSEGQGTASLVWLDGRNTAPAAVDLGHDHHAAGGAMTLRWARLGPGGERLESALLDGRVCDCCSTAAAVTDEGPVVVYRNRSENEIRDISIVRRHASGWSDPAAVHRDGWRITGCPVNGPAVIARGRAVVVAWFTLGADGVPRVRVARSEDGGRVFGAPRTLDAGVALGRVDLAWLDRGPVLSWMARTPEGAVLRLAQLDEKGDVRGIRDVTALAGARGSGFPRLLGWKDHSILLAWTDDAAVGGRSQVKVGTLRLD